MNELTTTPNNLPTTSDAAIDSPLVMVSDSLRQGLGANAHGHVAIVNDLLASAPSNVQRDLLQSGVFDKPHVVAWVAALLLDDGEGIEDAADIERAIREIEKLMADRGSSYWRGPDAERLQARYRFLIGSR